MSNLSKQIKVMREMSYASADINADKILSEFYDTLDTNEDILKECYKTDNDDNASFSIKKILDTIQSVKDYQFQDMQIFKTIDERKVVYYKQSLGVIGVFYNGNIYVTVELIAKSIKTGNAILFNVGMNNNIGTNNLIVKMIKEILEKNNKPTGLVEINFSETDEDIKENFDTAIFIGSRKKQKKYLSLFENLIVSGFGYGEIYIEDLENEEFIKNILNNNSKFKINVFIKKGLQTDIKGIEVENIEEAIKYINYTGSKYSSAVFSNDQFSQKLFMKRCKSKYVFINASPMLAEDLDIDIEKLYYKKVGMI